MVLAPVRATAIVLVAPVALKYITYCPPTLGFEKLIAVIFAVSVPVKIPVDRLLKLAVSVPAAKVVAVRVFGNVSCSVNVTGVIRPIAPALKVAIFVVVISVEPENIVIVLYNILTAV